MNQCKVLNNSDAIAQCFGVERGNFCDKRERQNAGITLVTAYR